MSHVVSDYIGFQIIFEEKIIHNNKLFIERKDYMRCPHKFDELVEEKDTMTTTSFYSCPKCGGVLDLVEHYFPRTGDSAFLLEYVVLGCKPCGEDGQGRSEGEALSALGQKLHV